MFYAYLYRHKECNRSLEEMAHKIKIKLLEEAVLVKYKQRVWQHGLFLALMFS